MGPCVAGWRKAAKEAHKKDPSSSFVGAACPYEPNKSTEDSLPCGEPTVEEGYHHERRLICDNGHRTDLDSEEDDRFDG